MKITVEYTAFETTTTATAEWLVFDTEVLE